MTTKHGAVVAAIILVVLCIVLVVMWRISATKVREHSPASVPMSAQYVGYLNFLKENTAREWHTVWEQLWSSSWSVRVPSSILKQYDTTQEAADKILEYIRAYIFWVDLPVDAQVLFTKTASGDLELTGFVYYVNADEVIIEVDRVLSSALVPILKEEDPKERVVLIDRYLRQNIVYSDDEPQEGQTLHSALANKRAVCAGFAYSFNVLALLSDLDSRIVTGHISVRQESGAYHVVRHAWNVVTIDGVDYMTDTTTNLTSRTRRIVNVPVTDIDSSYYLAIEGDYAKAVRLRKD